MPPGFCIGSKTLHRMFAAFTYRDFRVQWFGACTSSIGTWMQIVAQNWLVLTLTESAFFLGLDVFLQQLPIMLFTLIGGVSPIATTAARPCSPRSTCRWRPRRRWPC